MIREAFRARRGNGRPIFSTEMGKEALPEILSSSNVFFWWLDVLDGDILRVTSNPGWWATSGE